MSTIWQCPDELWEKDEPVLDELGPPAKTGRKRIDQRRALDGIIDQLRTGCRWNALPREFGDGSSVHRALQRRVERGVLPLVWSLLVAGCDEPGGVHFDGQAADCWMGKTRQGGIRFGRIPRIAGKTAASAVRFWIVMQRSHRTIWRSSDSPAFCCGSAACTG
jgi:putative transposase